MTHRINAFVTSSNSWVLELHTDQKIHSRLLCRTIEPSISLHCLYRAVQDTTSIIISTEVAFLFPEMSNIFEVNSRQNLSSATMEKDSPRYLQWKLSRLQEKYRNEREFWSKDCIQHSKDVQIWEDTIQALQLELAAIKERESQLINQLKISTDNIEKHVLEKAAMEESFEIEESKSKATQVGLHLQLNNNKEYYEKTLTKLKQEHEQIKTYMHAAFDSRLEQKGEETHSVFSLNRNINAKWKKLVTSTMIWKRGTKGF